MAAGLIGARSLLHVHDLNDPGPALSVLQGVRAHPMDAAVGVSQAVHELTVSRYHVRPARVRIARNGIPPEALRRAGAGAHSLGSTCGSWAGAPMCHVCSRPSTWC